MNISFRLSLPLLVGAVLLRPVIAAADDDGYMPGRGTPDTPVSANQYLVTNLTTNLTTAAPNTDKNLVNPWGLSRSSGSPWWVSDNGTGLSTLYTGTGAVEPLVVKIPPAQPKPGVLGSPTGTIFNGTMEFPVANGMPAFFLFATEDGTISGWNPAVNLGNAIIIVDESKQGASFKGLTAAMAHLPNHQNQTLLYAADFSRAKVEVFDGAFKHVRSVEERINGDEDMPHGYAPFNVQNLGNNIYITYAKLGSGSNEQDGAGLGKVRIYTPDGHLLLSLEHGSWFNAPWGVAIAPSDFGPYSHSILVGNFGSGWVASFDPVTGRFQDFLRDASGSVITIPGLWGISPGNDANAGNATTLYFAAGGAHETTGVLGKLTATQNPQGNDQ